ncbi:SacI homology domain-domain-containing protein [Absidia repens]|uniref:SacI homology domain-domain-containing protein n=1 Tax=Absidia repens TaxID=90262 RepID=A0A1X2IEJ3_9FUNG|nr:SacI homology domain-domain-containing protein [Absidia repens]
MGKQYEKLRLAVTKNSYVFTPLYEPASSTPDGPIHTLTIDRNKRQLKLDAPTDTQASMVRELVVYGILGFCRLQVDDYVIVVTGRTLVGTLFGNDILRATSFQILPLGEDSLEKSYSEDLFEQEQYFIQLLESHLQLNSFYLSYTYNLTNSLQCQNQKADERFLWNKHLSSNLAGMSNDSIEDDQINLFILPVIQGYINITSMIVNNKYVTFALISRRSNERAGTRYFSRGIDENGHVSNYVETEQLLVYDSMDPLSTAISNNNNNNSDATTPNKHLRLSFIQTRGSIPIFWGQIPNTRYVPQLYYEASTKNLEAAKKHFEDQSRIYGPNVLINLTNKTGYEQPLGDLYARTIQEMANPNLRYIHYDFHHECKNLQWHRVQLLIDRLIPDLEMAGYYCFDEESEFSKTQRGVVRTNCIDCLDRTNVVQSMMAKWMMQRWHQDIGIDLTADPTFVSVFNSAWADNADGLSLSYSGTGALKTDYTRGGKRTIKGAMNDLSNSLVRYMKNNYCDGSRQDGIDLFLGKYSRDATQQNRILCHYGQTLRYAPWKIQAIPPALVASTALFFWLLFFSDSTPIESSTLYILLLSFCFAVSVSMWLFIQQNGIEFIDWPRLNPLYPDTLSENSTIDLSYRLYTNWFLDSSENLDQAEQGKKTT